MQQMLFRRFDRAVGFTLVLGAVCSLTAQEPLAIGNRRQLLMDDRLVQKSQGIEFIVHQPKKTGDILFSSEPGLPLGGYHSVLYEGGTYHFWYSTGGGVLYARSRDGIHWEKPHLNLARAASNNAVTPQHNLVLGQGVGGVKGGMHGLMVFVDPNAGESDRFKLVANPGEFDSQLQIFSSPDGIHWRHAFTNVITFPVEVKPNHLDSQNVIFWDERVSKYVAYFRKNVRESGTKAGQVPRTRMVARAESATLDFFCKVEDAPVILKADPEHEVRPGSAGREAYTLLDVYTSGTIKYPWAESAYLMFPTEYYHYSAKLAEFRKEVPINAGVVDTRFASSRDGITWRRYDHRPFVPLGMKGEFDSKRIYMVYGIVPANHDRELFMYYLGTSETHGWDRDDRNNRLLTAADLAPTGPSVISRVVLRRDGFVSIRAGFSGGEFTTPLLRYTGEQLLLNVDTSAAGELRVEILDEQGQPVPDFTLAACDLIHTANEINRVVKWNGATSVGALAGKPIRLRFVMRDVHVYAFQFAERGGI